MVRKKWDLTHLCGWTWECLTEVQRDLLVEEQPIAVYRMLRAPKNIRSSLSSISNWETFWGEILPTMSGCWCRSPKCKATRTAEGSKITTPKPNLFAHGKTFWKLRLWGNDGKHRDVGRSNFLVKMVNFAIFKILVVGKGLEGALPVWAWEWGSHHQALASWEGMDGWCGIKVDMGPKPVSIMGGLLCPLQAPTVPAADSALWEVWAGNAGLRVHHLGQLRRWHWELRSPAGAGAQALLQRWPWAGQPGRGTWGLADGF